MKTSLIVAMAANGVIGRDNGLPWRLSSDLKRFKALTIGKPVIMGRKCFQSIGRPLPGRANVVVTRDFGYRPDGVQIAHSLPEALALATDQAVLDGVEEICVIGGGEIYRQALDDVDVLHVTHIDAAIEGDTHFPAIDPDVWTPERTEHVPAGEKDDYSSTFVSYARLR